MWSKIKYILSAVILLLLAILLIVGYNYLKDPGHLPIKTVKVDGKLNYLRQDQLRAVIEPHMVQSFFMLDVHSIQQALLQEPWMAHSSVRRVWPDTVLVQVQEHEPLAYWGTEGLISQETVLFRPDNLPAIELPRLHGPDDQTLAVLGMFNTLNRLLADHEVHLVGLKLNARRAWQADLDNGMHIQLGSVDVVERFERFLKSYPSALAENASQVRYVDLRYTNGFVIAKETAQ